MRNVNKIMSTTLLIFVIVLSGCLGNIHINEGYTDVIVQKKYIDFSDENSHYIIVTDKGLFEIDRPVLDIFNQSRNPDYVYSSIQEGNKYRIHHYGFKIDFLYSYPLVVNAQNITK